MKHGGPISGSCFKWHLVGKFRRMSSIVLLTSWFCSCYYTLPTFCLFFFSQVILFWNSFLYYMYVHCTVVFHRRSLYSYSKGAPDHQKPWWWLHNKYRKISNIRRTKSQNLNDSHLVLKSSLANLLKPGFKSRMKMKLEQRLQAMLQPHLSDRQLNCLLRCVL